ncbi:MAG: hypothetical protein H6745_13495 [Deltaproteobacteria bacterium]|nr:hypothetical protein [Deltaproteobacteria bacterium]
MERATTTTTRGGWDRAAVTMVAAALLAIGGCGKDGPAPTPAAAVSGARAEAVPTPAPAAGPRPRRPAEEALDDAPTEAPSEGDDEAGADEPEAGDTPHLDPALRVALEREGDVVRGRGFSVEGVPDDVTWYFPDDTGPERVYLVFDEVYEHVATVREMEDPAARAASDRPDAGTTLEDTGEPFAIWPSSLAPSQKKRGPGKRARFAGRGYRYQVDALVPLPWLTRGFRFTDAE